MTDLIIDPFSDVFVVFRVSLCMKVLGDVDLGIFYYMFNCFVLFSYFNPQRLFLKEDSFVLLVLD